MTDRGCPGSGLTRSAIMVQDRKALCSTCHTTQKVELHGSLWRMVDHRFGEKSERVEENGGSR